MRSCRVIVTFGDGWDSQLLSADAVRDSRMEFSVGTTVSCIRTL